MKPLTKVDIFLATVTLAIDIFFLSFSIWKVLADHADWSTGIWIFGFLAIFMSILIFFGIRHLNLDDEKKKTLKKVGVIYTLGYLFLWPLLSWLFGGIDSWKDVLFYMGEGLSFAILFFGFYLIGWIKPKKDELMKD